MNRTFKIIIDKNGNITSVYSDKLDFSIIGDIRINRATEVKFSNEPDFYWEIYSKNPVFQKEELIATGFKSRSEAIAFEVDYLNRYMEKIVGSKGSYIPREEKVL